MLEVFMFPTGSFGRMENELYWREKNKGTDIPITVEILIADVRRQLEREYIFNYINRLNLETGNLIDFYIPGYIKVSNQDDYDNMKYYLNNCTERFKLGKNFYYFSYELFYEFLDKLGEHSNKHLTPDPKIILVSYADEQICFGDSIVFDLRKEDRENSISELFQFIINIARKTTEFEEFKRKIFLDNSKNKFIKFVKNKLPDQLLSFVISKF